MIVSLVTKEKDGVPYLGLEVEDPEYYLVESQDKFPSHQTIRSEDGEIDITVHTCELMTHKGKPDIEILVVVNLVGRGIVIKSEICGAGEANNKLNALIRHTLLGD